ncbi:hypothetical protein E2C01_071640 [Portunus trituberculatus]|uniref:Uncharacterized protein n=1 Tax=Portunus trituberculatus TaxID=210409 RepID=A0A5B7I0F5_PORTR|nr:hypothetical protein [Portunus trituberculatus]
MNEYFKINHNFFLFFIFSNRYVQEYIGDSTIILKEGKEEEERTWERAWEEGGVAGDPLRSLVVARRLAKDWPRLRDMAPSTLKDWKDIEVAVEGVEKALRMEAGKDIYLEALEESLAYLHHLYHLDALHLARGHHTNTPSHHHLACM